MCCLPSCILRASLPSPSRTHFLALTLVNSAHFCLIAAVSWQKATIFALLLSCKISCKLFIYAHTHTRHTHMHTQGTHTHTCSYTRLHTRPHTRSALQSRQQKLIVFFFGRVDRPLPLPSGRGTQQRVLLIPRQPWLCLCLCLCLCLSGPKVILTKIPSVGIICISCGFAFSFSLSLFLLLFRCLLLLLLLFLFAFLI